MVYCDRCGRMVGISCACDLTFAEKARSIRIDKAKMDSPELKNYYDKEAITEQFGDDAKDRYWEETNGLGAARPGPDGALWHANRHTGEPERLTDAQVDSYLGADTELQG